MSEGKGLYVKLAEITAELGRVEKRGRNDFHKYDYVLEADLLEAVRLKLAERKVAVLPSLTALSHREGTKQSTITTAHVRFTFVDGESGEKHECDWAGEGDDPADKGLNKAYTAAVKYFVMKAFLIPTGDDPEGDHKTDERASARASAPKPNGKTTTLPPSPVDEVVIGAIVARALEVVDLDRLHLAATHINGSDPWAIFPAEEMEKRRTAADAVTALKSFSPEQAKRLAEWIEKKAEEKATA